MSQNNKRSNSSESGSLYHMISWICLGVGLMLPFGIVLMIVGWLVGNKAIAYGSDANLARNLNAIFCILAFFGTFIILSLF